jgi:hypothetical protein
MTPNLGIFASQISGHLAAPSSFYNIATVTPSATFTFSSIPQTYKSLQLRCLYDAGGATISLRFNSDSGGNYSYHGLKGDGSSASAEGVGGSNFALDPNYPLGGYPSSSYLGAQIIDIIDYASTSKYKTIRNFGGINTNNTGFDQIMIGSAAWRNTSAISSITVYNCVGGTIALYGIN